MSSTAEAAADTRPIEEVVRETLAGSMTAGYDRVMSRLADHCLALKVTVHGAAQECKIDNATVSVGGEELADDTVARSTGLAMPKGVRTRLGRVADQLRAVPGRFGTRFPGGAYLIPLRAGTRRPAETVLVEIARLRQVYTETAESCRDEWLAYMADLQTKNSSVYARVRRACPTGEAFVAAHQVKTLTFPLGRSLSPAFWDRARDLLAEHLTDSDALNSVMRRLTDLSVLPDPRDSDADARWAREQSEAAGRMVSETVTAMVADPLREFAEALDHIDQAVSTGRVIREGSLDNLRAAWEKLTAFEFMLPSETALRLRSVGDQLQAMTARDVNQDVREGGDLTTFFRQVREEVAAPAAAGEAAQSAARWLMCDD